jgi:hypothetical protein
MEKKTIQKIINAGFSPVMVESIGGGMTEDQITQITEAESLGDVQRVVEQRLNEMKASVDPEDTE